MPLTIRRLVETPHGMLGQISLETGTALFSMERRRTGDHPCIPAGIYEIHLDVYHKGGYPAYEITVPGRSRILIHAANRARELEGCIAPGRSLGFLADELAVLGSREALKTLMASLHDTNDYITITDPQEVT